MSDERPRRLRDDPEFLALAGLRLDDEEATAASVDVDAGRAQLEAAIAHGTPTVMGSPDLLSTVASKVTLGLVVAATVAGVALWPAGDGGPEQAPVITSAPVIEAPSEPPAPPAVEPTPAVVVEPAAPATPVAPPEAAPVPSPPPAATRPSRRSRAITPATAPIVAAPRSTLPEQLALYEEGKGALASGDHAGAIAAFEAYAERFPTGSLRRETRLSMLEALVRSGRSRRAGKLATSLLSRGGLGKRAGDVRRVLGETQARVGRCDDAAITLATALHEGASGLTLATVEAAVAHCRGKQEVTP